MSSRDQRSLANLCGKLGEKDKEFSVLLGQAMFHVVRANMLLARELAEQAVELTKSFDEPGFDLAALRQLAYSLCYQGDFQCSQACIDKVAKSYDIDPKPNLPKFSLFKEKGISRSI